MAEAMLAAVRRHTGAEYASLADYSDDTGLEGKVDALIANARADGRGAVPGALAGTSVAMLRAERTVARLVAAAPYAPELLTGPYSRLHPVDDDAAL